MEADIKQKIKQDFKEDADNAISQVETFESKFSLSPRVSRCIVHLAQGDLNKLISTIKDAEKDWRAVINYAESVEFEFNKPFNLES